ncbi:hypothetical protein DQ241_14095 [Blastococcus sp. TF02A-30]|nr:hypothetical protein DQ241_14095 [Blastococcus sp. TF02A-30]
MTAAVVLVPSVASAAPSSTTSSLPVTTSVSYLAQGEVQLADGRTAQVSLGEYASRLFGPRQGSLGVSIAAPCASFPCGAPESGYAELTGAQVDFALNLGRASVSEVPVTLTSSSYGPDGWTRTERQVTASVTFTATGPTVRNAYSSPVCGDGSEGCRSFRLDASRPAAVTVVIDGASSSGSGTLGYGYGLDIGTPQG